MMSSRPTKVPPQMNRMLRGIDLDVLLLGMLAAALRRDVADGAFEHLQQGLLDALAGDVAGDGDVLAGLGDLVDFVDVDDAALGCLDVEVGGVEQLEQQVLDVLADVAGLGEGGGVADGEGDVEDLGEGAGEQRLAAAGRADQQDVALIDFDVGMAFVAEAQSLVVVVDGNGEHLLGAVLADDVLVELILDGAGGRDVGDGLLGDAAAFAFLLVDDRLAELDAFAADVDVAWAFDEGTRRRDSSCGRKSRKRCDCGLLSRPWVFCDRRFRCRNCSWTQNLLR